MKVYPPGPGWPSGNGEQEVLLAERTKPRPQAQVRPPGKARHNWAQPPPSEQRLPPSGETGIRGGGEEGMWFCVRVSAGTR